MLAFYVWIMLIRIFYVAYPGPVSELPYPGYLIKTALSLLIKQAENNWAEGSIQEESLKLCMVDSIFICYCLNMLLELHHPILLFFLIHLHFQMFVCAYGDNNLEVSNIVEMFSLSELYDMITVNACLQIIFLLVSTQVKHNIIRLFSQTQINGV